MAVQHSFEFLLARLKPYFKFGKPPAEPVQLGFKLPFAGSFACH